MKKIPIKAVKDLAKKYNLKQAILFGWDGKRTHSVTYGETVDDCDQASQGAKVIQRGWEWPDEIVNQEPTRVQKLKDEIKELKKQLKD